MTVGSGLVGQFIKNRAEGLIGLCAEKKEAGSQASAFYFENISLTPARVRFSNGQCLGGSGKFVRSSPVTRLLRRTSPTRNSNSTL